MAFGKKQEFIIVEPPRTEMMVVKAVGDSPLIMHAMSEKHRKQLLASMQKKSKGVQVGGRPDKDPVTEYENSTYKVDGHRGDFIRCISFKTAAINACTHCANVTKTSVRGAFYILGEYAQIIGKKHMREDVVRLSTGATDLRYRAEFPEWEVELTIQYNPNIISPEHIINLLNLAGKTMGVAERRPQQCGDSFGLFHIESIKSKRSNKKAA